MSSKRSPLSQLSLNQARYLPFILVFAIILFTGLRPDPIPEAFDQQDKLHHLLGFAALMFSLRLAFTHWRLVWTVAMSLTVAFLIEVGQSFLPGRQASYGDMAANTLGVLLGWGCYHLTRQWYLRRIGVTSDPEQTELTDGLGDSARS